MKRNISVLLALAIIAIAACSAFAATFINIGTGTTGGTYYPVGAAMAKVWNANITGMKANAQSTGGTAQNLALLGKGETEVIFADGLYFSAYKGTGMFQGKKMANLRGLVPLYAEPIHFLVAKGGKIKTTADLKGKRVSVGAVGSGTEVTARTILQSAGLDPDKDIKAENLGLSDTAAAFADKNIDAAITVGALGIAGVVEITTLGTADFRDIPADTIAKVSKLLPYYLPFDIPANTYKGQAKPVKSMASWNVLITTSKLSDNDAYAMTKALYQHKKDILNVSTRLTPMDPSNLKYIQVPLHNGALKYYKEIGAVK
ncbi:MAG: TAXI family TRAP transporter solute-binding subunit [Synergistaceae bacterium]|nr:TAXI family TRAP transporter solute-binding subunit [Synergistaceae bacterium]